ncbi:iron-siderophore ABC transporter substrate-binding protein [Aureimonas sp. AU4]|uniref:iron-siderophore ABC transporter substrate-binding protein n=1 Tax=Aureimonas sp. AU4 TaxID=1638163 RepID=UPI000783C12A|nr:iron-siderophore ABC transporter substrate-binding protein [Aureimonas sp. AU4]
MIPFHLPGRLTASRESPGPTRRTVLGGLACALFARPAWAQAEIRFRHVFGETVLAKPAVRIVSLGFTTQDPLLALGVQPVAVRAWFGDQPASIWPWAQPYLRGEAPAVIAGEVAMETVASLRPDLIVAIGSGITQDEYAILSQIAPTLMQPPGAATYALPWDETTRLLGRALGRDALAEERIAETRRLFAEARARHPDWEGRSAAAAYHFGGETGAFTAEDTRGRFLSELGFQIPQEIERLGGGHFYAGLSPEDLSPLDADLLVWVSSLDAAPDLAALPMRRLLGAHREGREVFAGALTAGALSFGSVLSLPFALAQLEGDMALALDGDPATAVPSAVRAGLAP